MNYNFLGYSLSKGSSYLSSSSRVYAIKAAPFSTVAQVDPRCEGAFPLTGLAKHFLCRCLDTIKNIPTASRRITAVKMPIITAM